MRNVKGNFEASNVEVADRSGFNLNGITPIYGDDPGMTSKRPEVGSNHAAHLQHKL